MCFSLSDGQDMAELNGLLQASNSGEIITKLKKILKYRSNCAFMLRVVVSVWLWYIPFVLKDVLHDLQLNIIILRFKSRKCSI